MLDFETIITIIFDFIQAHTINIVVIVAGGLLARSFAKLTISRIVRKTLRSNQFDTKRDEELREDTLVGIISSVIRVITWILIIMLILSEVGIDIAPLIAGAGVIGIAIGFGAQSLVKDIIAGMFILAENQYRVSDVIEVNQTVIGTVERFTLRTTALRDIDGMLHHVPNGIIEIATNRTKDFARVNLEIGVGYETDIDKLEKAVNDVGIKIAKETPWSDYIKNPPYFAGIKEFADSAMVIKIYGETSPIRKWEVSREMNKRLKKAFDKHGIDIPYPQRVIHQAKKSPKKK